MGAQRIHRWLLRDHANVILLCICLVIVGGCDDGGTAPPTMPTPAGTSTPPPAPAPVDPPTLESMTLIPSSILSQGTSEGSVTLTREAPAGGVVVTLSSSAEDVARTEASVTVRAGSTSSFFFVSAATVARTSTTVISATYQNVTRTATLTVSPRTLEAGSRFANRPSARLSKVEGRKTSTRGERSPSSTEP